MRIFHGFALLQFLFMVKCVFLWVVVNLLGPGVGGDYGPYRQSDRNSLYKQFADNLHQSGHVYRCFCSNEVLLELASSECVALDWTLSTCVWEGFSAFCLCLYERGFFFIKNCFKIFMLIM